MSVSSFYPECSPAGTKPMPESHPLVVAAGGVLLALLLSACGGSTDKAGGKGGKRDLRFPVQVEAVAARPTQFSIAAVGSVAAFETVAITARVAGAIEKVSFQEGETADTERVLVEIEPERYRLAVDSAKAAMVRAESALKDADSSLARRESVNRDNPGLVRDEDLQTARARSASSRADVDQAKSALALAELNLRDALVRSPIAGVLQTREVQTGQYVQPGTRLGTVMRRDPLLLRFRVPEGDAAYLKEGQPLGFTAGGEGPFSAVITLVGGAADPVSRLVDITARVDDAKRERLRPGSFAQVTVPVGSSELLATIPQSAVRPSELGFVAFVVERRGEQEVAVRCVVTLGLRTTDGNVGVRSGLTPGQRLVVRGAEALDDGSVVLIEGAAKAAKGPEKTPDKVPVAASDGAATVAPATGKP
jgi:multidrug efflux system membrane fusion protein